MWSKKRYSILMLAALFCTIILGEYFYFDLFSDATYSLITNDDGREYLDAMDSFFDEFKGHPTRPVGYTFFLRIIYLLSGGVFNYKIFFFAHLLIWFCTTIITFFSIRLFRGNKISFLLSSILLLLPGTSLRCFQIWTEPLYAFLLSCIVLFLLIGYKKQQISYFTGSWIILVFSVLVRPTLFYTCILIFPIFFYYYLKNKVYYSLVFISILSFLLIGGQARLIYNLTGEYKLSYIADITTYYYFSAYVVATNSTDSKDMRDARWFELRTERENELGLQADIFSGSVLAKDDWKTSTERIRKIIKREVSKNGCVTLFIYTRNFLQNSTGGNDNLIWINQDNSFTTRVFYLISRLQCTLFTFTFLFTLFFHLTVWKNWQTQLWILKSIIFLIILNLILTDPISFAQGDRFRVVIFPISLILLSLPWKVIMLKDIN